MKPNTSFKVSCLNLIFSVNLEFISTDILIQFKGEVFVEPTRFHRVSEKKRDDAENGDKYAYDSGKISFAKLEPQLSSLAVALLRSHIRAKVFFGDEARLHSRVLPVNNGQN